MATALECVVCGTLLRPHAPGTTGPYPICHAVPCRMVLDQRATLGEAAFRQRLQRQALNTRAQRAKAREEDQRLRALFAKEDAEDTARWASFEAQAPGAHPPEHFLRLVLPSGPGRARRLPVRRLRQYSAHLSELIAEAVLPEEPSVLGSADGTPVNHGHTRSASHLPGHLCATCRGGCCPHGGDTAYLTVATLRRFMAAYPALSPDEVLSAYLDRVRSSTQADSCINHTDQGCSLPTEMRSDTCNRYLCAAQKTLHERLDEGEPLQGVLVIHRRQNHWDRHKPGVDNGIVGGATLTEAGITPWPEAP
jgi:hypothetical protein